MKSLTLKPAEAVGMTRAEKRAVKAEALEGLRKVREALSTGLQDVKVPRLAARDMEREFERDGHPKRGR